MLHEDYDRMSSVTKKRKDSGFDFKKLGAKVKWLEANFQSKSDAATDCDTV
jgi:hypothetical protein